MYHVALFVHICGVLTLVVGVFFSFAGLVSAQRARDVAGVRRALTFAPLGERLIPIGIVVIPAAGLYMASRHGDDGTIRWSSGWLDVAIPLFALLVVLGGVVEGRRVSALHRAAELAADGPLTDDLRARLRDPVLSHTSAFGACQIGTFLWLMTNKPGLGVALLTVGVATVVSVPLARLMLAGARGAKAAGLVPAQATPPQTLSGAGDADAVSPVQA